MPAGLMPTVSPTAAVPRRILERRWDAFQRLIEREALDLLVLCGRGKPTQYGPVCYATGFVLFSVPSYVVIRPGQEPRLLLNEREASFAREIGLGDLLHDSCRGPGHIPPPGAQLRQLVESLKLERGRIGVVGLEQIMPVGDYLALTKACPGAEIVDQDPAFATLKAVKDADEILLVEEAYAIADVTLESLTEAARPGCTEWEVAADLERMARSKGAVQTFIMLQHGSMLPRYPTARVFEQDDLAACVVELIAPNGYWVEKATMFSLGSPDESGLELCRAAERALEAAAAQLKPSTPAKDVARAAATSAAENGMTVGALVGHGVGVDHDSPSISESDAGVVPENGVIALHPHVLSPDRSAGAKFCEQYVIQADGARRLSRLRTELWRL